jgi:hypothetical protein
MGLNCKTLYGRIMMNFIINDFTLTRIGLVFNLLGTIMISFSFGKHIGEGYNENDKGEKIYLSSFLHPILFRWGLITLGFGFVLQFID